METQVQNILVTILLSGGHTYTIPLESNSPLLINLMRAIAVQAQLDTTPHPVLFQIPVNGKRQALCFSSSQLVGLLTDPPIFIQQQQQQQQPLEIPTPPQQPEPEPLKPNIIPSQFIQLDNFLTPADVGRLLKYIFKHEREFVSTSTSTGADNYRRSMVLYSFPEFSKLLIEKVRANVPNVLDKLNIPQFEVSEIECQLTSHNDGNFYKLHNDSGSKDTLTRELTYVYYFHRQPKGFTGGELRIYDSTVKNRYFVAAETFKDVEPRHNSIVFFPSRYMHEVLPIQCASRRFEDSRFTINGWVRRQG